MRVIAGSAKGRELKGPRAPRTGASRIRPTSDKVRGALFDILAGRVVGARVLDLYAGTGGLAIEALSRGAASADLVEADREAWRLITENLTRAGFAVEARLWRMRVERALPLLTGQYDLILADPPYASEQLTPLLASLASDGLLREGGIVIFEHASRVPPPEGVSGLILSKSRRHGDTTLSMYEMSMHPPLTSPPSKPTAIIGQEAGRGAL